MMATQKSLLHELLQEDQEPFLLKNYIAEKRCQLKKSSHLQLKKFRKPLIEKNSNFPSKFCLFSYQDSPDVRKSPLLPSPVLSPCNNKNPNAIFLHIPARTSSLLLDAALRIQKQKHSSKKTNSSFGLFSSMLKKLTQKSRTRKREISDNKGVVKVSVKDILRWDSSRKLVNECEKVGENLVIVRSNEMGFGCSCNNDRLSSGLWSESNEETSLDLETSLSCSSHSEDDEIESKNLKENEFCHSPFHFVLQKFPPSPGHRTPVFSSPATSPTRHQIEDSVNYGGESLKKFQSQEEDEEKEQCSPVSVLDTPFEDNDGQDDEDDNSSYDLECSYAIVQRAKQQLLHKLRRFEKLAQLDPLELEERLLEDDEDDEDYDMEDLEDEEECQESKSMLSIKVDDDFVKEILQKSGFQNMNKVPADMKRLVSDLIAEEERDGEEFDEEDVLNKVCQRLDSWKEVQPNTIDMMVEIDFRRELDGWKKNQEQVGETSKEIELAIFGLLVEELSEDLVCLSGLDVTV